jgi:hypothetical protein
MSVRPSFAGSVLMMNRLLAEKRNRLPPACVRVSCVVCGVRARATGKKRRMCSGVLLPLAAFRNSLLSSSGVSSHASCALPSFFPVQSVGRAKCGAEGRRRSTYEVLLRRHLREGANAVEDQRAVVRYYNVCGQGLAAALATHTNTHTAAHNTRQAIDR